MKEDDEEFRILGASIGLKCAVLVGGVGFLKLPRQFLCRCSEGLVGLKGCIVDLLFEKPFFEHKGF